MKHTIITTLAMTFLGIGHLFSQELPQVIPASPTVASLMHFEEVPIDYYSGQPNIQFPIYGKAIGSNVTIPIALRYSTLGIRVDERSGWTGTGWALDGEAVISRTVRGIRDEARLIDFVPGGQHEVGVYHNGYFDLDFSNPSANINNQTIQNFLWNASGKGSGSQGTTGNGAYDKEPDLYQLSLFGTSARFVVVKSNNQLEVKMLSNDANLLVVPTYNPTSFVISSFTVKDTNGVNYLFDVTEINSTTSASSSELQNHNITSASFSSSQSISSWKVREIRNSLQELLATYYYHPVSDEVFNLPVSTVEHHMHSRVNLQPGHGALEDSNYTGNNPDDNYGLSSYNNSIAEPRRTVSLSSVIIHSRKLSSIVFRDQSSIHFILKSGAHPEYSNNSGNLLEKIEIKDQNDSLFKYYQFEYWNNTNNRVFLNSIKEYFNGNPNHHTYNFSYDRKELLPGKPNVPSEHASKTDLWGYYKEPEAPYSPIVYHLPEKSADKDNVTVGVLKTISYPTGGNKTFEFESNTFSHMGSRPFSDLEFKMLNPDNWNMTGSTQITVSYNNTGSGSPSVTQSNVVFISDEQDVQFIADLEYGTHDYETDYILGNILVRLNKVQQDGTLIEQVDAFNFLDNRKTFLETGYYQLEYVSLILPDPSDPDIRVKGELLFKKFYKKIDRLIYGGGLRIKSVVFKDTDNSQERKMEYKYEDEYSDNFPLPTIKKISTGVIDGFLTNYKEYVIGKEHVFATITGIVNNNTLIGPHIQTINYSVKEYLNSAYVSMSKGNYVGYRKVEMSESENGKTIFNYTTPADYPTYNTQYGWPFTPEKDKSHLHGNLVTQKVYDSNDFILKQVTNTYHEPIEILQSKTLFTYDGNCGWTKFYTTYSDYLAHFPSTGREFPGDTNPSASSYLNCVIGAPTSTVNVPVFYKYDNLYFTKFLLKDTSTIDYFYTSDGEQSTKTTKQTFDYNLINYQVSEQHTYYEEKGINEHYQTNTYYPVGPNLGSNSSAVRAALNANNKIHEVLETVSKKNGITTSRTNTLYHSFQTNQVLPKTVQTSKGTNPFENRIEFYNYDKFGNPLEVSKTSGTRINYIWGYHRTYPVAKVTNATKVQIDNILGANYDLLGGGLSAAQKTSLKNGLPNAQITFYDYDPMIGIIKATDERDNYLVYEYDDFKRLAQVKDKDNFILSKNEYLYGIPNYVKTTNYQVATTTGTVTDDNKVESITYLDGLGRPIQSVLKQGGGNKQDIISPVVYDALGRTPKQYLPYSNPNQVVGTANLNFRDPVVLLTDLETYYANSFVEDQIGANTINAYSESIFEKSPLSRVIEQGAPGKDWNIDVTQVTYQNHNVSYPFELEDFSLNINDSDLSQTTLSSNPVGLLTITNNEVNFTFDGVWAPSKLNTGHIVYLNTNHVLDDIELGQLKDGNGNFIPYFLEIQEGYLHIRSTDSGFMTNSVDVSFTYTIPAEVNRDYEERISTNHSIKFAYQTNDENEVELFRVIFPTLNTEQPQLFYDGFYAANELYKTITKDENWQPNANPSIINKAHTTEEFKNAQGQVVLKRTYDSQEVEHDTYYVYDDFGNLTYVLSPKGADLILSSNSIKNDTDIIECSKFIPLDKKGEPIISVCSGDVAFTIDASNLTLNVNFSLQFGSAIDLKNGPIALLQNKFPNLIIGTITASGANYTLSTQDGYLYIVGSGALTSVVQTFTVDLPTHSIETPILDNLCYQYRYDKRNRLVEKKIPQKGWEYIVYDKLDRPVLTQDAILRTSNDWLFTKYDAFDRVVYTGRFKTTSLGNNRISLQNTFNNQSNLNESRTTTATLIDGVNVYYSKSAYPTSINKLYTVNYYDSYSSDVTSLFPNPTPVLGQTVSTSTKSLPTASKVRVLDTNNWITSVTYYDDKARPIYSASKNDYLSTTDVVKMQLDFIGKTIKTESSHTKGANTAIVVTDDYTYDHAGRMLTQKQKIGTGAQELIVKNTYDELGQLKDKKVGNSETTPLQTVDYSYNIRGWLKQINNPQSIGNDLFTFAINYNTTTLGQNNQALYNGNISETIWKTANDVTSNTTRGYAYQYDALNRLNTANMSITTGSGYNLASGYHENGLLYDKNGNIMSLQRTGATTVFDNLTYIYNGNQLSSVTDAVSNQQTEGFIDGNTVGDDYTYDANGNMKIDKNKGITNIVYNHLNLPTQVNFGATNNIQYVYDATGVKLKKRVDDLGQTTFTSYAGNYIYEDAGTETLKFFSHPEGYVEPDGQGNFDYIYQYKDHLGNIRLSYKDVSTTTTPLLEIIEENNYYPFGLKHKGYNNVINGTENNHFTYVGKELNESLGYDILEMDWRHYDSAIGRFVTIDLMAESFEDFTPYHYSNNSPIMYKDPTGLFTDVVNKDDPSQAIHINDGYDFIFYVNQSEFDEIEEKNSIKGTKSYWRWWKEAFVHEMKKSDGTASGDILQFLIYDDLGDAVTTLSKKQYGSTVLNLTLGKLKKLKQLKKWVDKNEGTKIPGTKKGGGIFKNDGREGGEVLPRKDANGKPITYREYDVNPTPKAGQNRGTERMVVGDGKAYYTDNHYKTFTEIKD